MIVNINIVEAVMPEEMAVNMWDELRDIRQQLRALRDQVTALQKSTTNIDTDVQKVLKYLTTPVGIDIQPGVPTEHKEKQMAKVKVTLVKKKPGVQAAPKAKAGDPVVEFQIQDNQDATFTVFGVNAQGNQLDINGVATLQVASDNTPILTVDPPTGMTSAMHAVNPVGKANVTATVTWNDGSIGPFSFTLPVDVIANPQATGVIIVPGTPTSH